MFSDLIESWNGLLEGRELPPHLRVEGRSKAQQAAGQQAAAGRIAGRPRSKGLYDRQQRISRAEKAGLKRGVKASPEQTRKAFAKAKSRVALKNQPGQSPMGKKVRAFKADAAADAKWTAGQAAVRQRKKLRVDRTNAQGSNRFRQSALDRAHYDAGGGPYRR